ncbi:MAG TPA: hypothetical protein VFW03_04660 [Gemmatimonadaceae bacterium]|nr:hypothetical protein [Gemmatimonadaceae bacterium]
MTFPRGLYDLFLTEAVARALDGVAPDVPDVRVEHRRATGIT